MFDVRPALRPDRPYREKDRETALWGRSLVSSLVQAGNPLQRDSREDKSKGRRRVAVRPPTGASAASIVLFPTVPMMNSGALAGSWMVRPENQNTHKGKSP